jgi:CRISPR-associated endonuclease/helicase Cas3
MEHFIAHYLEPNKKGQSVREHLHEVSDAASIFAGKVGLPSMGQLMGLLHDFGKYSEAFQIYIRSAEGMLDPDAEPVDANELKGKIDHSTAGAQRIWGAPRGHHPASRLAMQAVALCIASHHSGLIDCISPSGEDKFSARMAKRSEKTHLKEALKVADQEILAEVDGLLHSLRWTEELQNQLERLFSDENSSEVREFYLGLLVRFLFSALIDADRLSAAGRSSTSDGQTMWDHLIQRLERHVSGIKPGNWVDELRSEVSLACREFASPLAQGRGLKPFKSRMSS